MAGEMQLHEFSVRQGLKPLELHGRIQLVKTRKIFVGLGGLGGGKA